ncbi:MAG: 2-oxo acid dehydrogenase subunit E2, partial [Moraxellaceae bacterium]|nr:2-oxo acid dehydrogenase subunit E2 [Moraxellaceae bacterium]
DTVKVGDALLQFDAADGESKSEQPAATDKPKEAPKADKPAAETASKVTEAKAPSKPAAEKPASVANAPAADANVYAGPAVRRLARELGVGLGAVTGSGPKQRILKEDVHDWVKAELSKPRGASVSADLPPEPDYSKWGEVDLQPRSRIQRKSAENLARSANIVPQVTQFDEADITELEAFRLSLKDRFKAEGLSLTMTALVAKTVAYLLQEMPAFNSSLSRDGENLVVKQYVNLGIAVDTPNGLLVPVLHNANTMGLRELSARLGELAEQARTGKLPPAAMQGATFTISSLGGIGGTAFTPLVNWPEVGILGLSRAQHKPVWDGQAFVPRLMLPLSLSYDHRVIDGASAARFTTRLSQLLADVRQLLV